MPPTCNPPAPPPPHLPPPLHTPGHQHRAHSPRGMPARICASYFSGMAAVMSDAMKPGATALQVMLRPAYSRAVVLVRPITPAHTASQPANQPASQSVNQWQGHSPLLPQHFQRGRQRPTPPQCQDHPLCAAPAQTCRVSLTLGAVWLLQATASGCQPCHLGGCAVLWPAPGPWGAGLSALQLLLSARCWGCCAVLHQGALAVQLCASQWCDVSARAAALLSLPLTVQ
jgi:hypothetical protein